jgi:rhodanese-related sulfurtransferase
VPGVRTPNLLKEIAFDWRNYVDHIKEIGTKESFESSLALCRAGLMVGPSAGFTLVGLLDFIKDKKKLGQLDKYRNIDGEIVAVFICPDSPLPYLEEYFEYLDDSYFPKIENENLLINKPDTKDKKKEVFINNLPEIKAEDAYRLLYPVYKKELWKIVNEEKEVQMNKNILIIDVRTDQEFQHFHLPGSRHIELQKLTKQLPKLQKESKGKKVVFVCKTGNRSGIATQLARTRNIDALNLIGGVTEWSRLNFPRIRPQVCVDNHWV